MQTQYSDPHVVASQHDQHSATLIFLHGLGDNGSGWADSLSMIVPPHIKVICPNACKRPVTLNGGAVMPAWFDIVGLDLESPLDEPGMEQAAEYIRSLIESEHQKCNLPYNRIMVGGFSQGGRLSFYVGLRNKQPLAGIIVLSSWLPFYAKFPEVFVPSNKDVPVLQCHGTEDMLIPSEWAKLSSEKLTPLLANYQLKMYQGLGHSSNTRELEDVKDFIQEKLPPL